MDHVIKLLVKKSTDEMKKIYEPVDKFYSLSVDISLELFGQLVLPVLLYDVKYGIWEYCTNWNFI